MAQTQRLSQAIGVTPQQNETNGLPHRTYYYSNRSDFVIQADKLSSMGLQTGDEINGFYIYGQMGPNIPISYHYGLQNVSYDQTPDRTEATLDNFTTGSITGKPEDVETNVQYLELDTPFIYAGDSIHIFTNRRGTGYQNGGFTEVVVSDIRTGRIIADLNEASLTNRTSTFSPDAYNPDVSFEVAEADIPNITVDNIGGNVIFCNEDFRVAAGLEYILRPSGNLENNPNYYIAPSSAQAYLLIANQNNDFSDLFNNGKEIKITIGSNQGGFFSTTYEEYNAGETPEPEPEVKNSIKFNGVTSFGQTSPSQSQFDLNTVYMDIDFNVSGGAQQVYFNTQTADDGMLSQSGGVEINSFGTNGFISRYPDVPNGRKKIVLQWDDSRSRYNMYIEGQLTNSNGSIAKFNLSQLTLGRFATGGRFAEMEIFDIRFSSLPVGISDVSNIFNGNTTSIDDAEIIYNQFNEEERDNDLIKNKGFLSGEYDLNTTNVVFEDALEPEPEPEPEPLENKLVFNSNSLAQFSQNYNSINANTIVFDLITGPAIPTGWDKRYVLLQNDTWVSPVTGLSGGQQKPVIHIQSGSAVTSNFETEPNTQYRIVYGRRSDNNNWTIYVNGVNTGQTNSGSVSILKQITNDFQINNSGETFDLINFQSGTQQLTTAELLDLSIQGTEIETEIQYNNFTTTEQSANTILNKGTLMGQYDLIATNVEYNDPIQEDITPDPTILITNQTPSIFRTQSFNYLDGVSATDFFGVDITSDIVVTEGNTVVNTPNYFVNLGTGSYTLTYSVSDSYGGSTQETSTLTVNEPGDPTLIVPNQTPTIEQGQQYQYLQGVSAEDFFGNDITSNIVVTEGSNTVTSPNYFTSLGQGQYNLDYSVTDSLGKQATIRAILNVALAPAPDINFTNQTPEIFRGNPFDYLAGVTATDFNGNDITSDIVVRFEGNIITDNNFTIGLDAGDKTIEYSVTDSNNKTTTINLILTIKENSAPNLEIGPERVEIIRGENFDYLQGVSATDFEGTNLTSQIVVTESGTEINTPGYFASLIPGNYFITYSVTDRFNITTAKIKILTVIAQAFATSYLQFNGTNSDAFTPAQSIGNVGVIYAEMTPRNSGWYVSLWESTNNRGLVSRNSGVYQYLNNGGLTANTGTSYGEKVYVAWAFTGDNQPAFYVNGVKYPTTTHNTRTVNGLRLGSQRGTGAFFDGDIYDVRIDRRIFTEQDYIQLSTGDTSILDDADIIYNNFTQEEADNNVVLNKGTLDGYNLTLSNVEIINTNPNNTIISESFLPYLVKPQYLTHSQDFNGVNINLQESFEMNVIKIGLLYNNPFTPNGVIFQTQGGNTVRFNNTNRFVIDANDPNNTPNINSVTLEAPDFRFIPGNYYSIVIKYDTTTAIRNYKVWINGDLINMGYVEGRINRRMRFGGNLRLCNAINGNLGSNINLYSFSFTSRQLSDFECQTASYNFAQRISTNEDVIGELEYLATNAEYTLFGENNVLDRLPETLGRDMDAVGTQTRVVEEEIKRLSRVLGDSRVIIPLDVFVPVPEISGYTIDTGNNVTITLSPDVINNYRSIENDNDIKIDVIERIGNIVNRMTLDISEFDLFGRTTFKLALIPDDDMVKRSLDLTLQTTVTTGFDNEVITTTESNATRIEHYYWKSVNTGTSWDTRADLNDRSRELGEIDLSTVPNMAINIGVPTTNQTIQVTYGTYNSSNVVAKLTSAMASDAPQLFSDNGAPNTNIGDDGRMINWFRKSGNTTYYNYRTIPNTPDTPLWATPIGYVNRFVNDRPIWISDFSVQYGMQRNGEAADMYISILKGSHADGEGATKRISGGNAEYISYIPTSGNGRVVGTETKLYPGDMDQPYERQNIYWRPVNNDGKLAYGIRMRVAYREWTKD